LLAADDTGPILSIRVLHAQWDGSGSLLVDNLPTPPFVQVLFTLMFVAEKGDGAAVVAVDFFMFGT
jgi:hypothetical protein